MQHSLVSLRNITTKIGLAIGVSFLMNACASNKPVEEKSEEYTEKYRPQLHFSPKEKWMNDPNGMVYHKDEYHLFYQHYPDDVVWGPMHWGHAISKDLIHWEHLPIALYPDSLGYIFSGSAVFDEKNTSGLGTPDNPPLVAIFTYHDANAEKKGQNDFQTQGIAYSLDDGRTWTKYKSNPVIKNPGIRDFRDPKVFWHKESEAWVMILAVKDHVELYKSPDLKTWHKLSDFGLDYGNHGGVWECPDLFKIKVEGDSVEKWVMLVSIGDGAPNGGSGTQYFVGDFDGKKFNCETEKDYTAWIDYGMDNYAGITWSNIPPTDGRRIFLGWMSNWKYANVVPTEGWRSSMTIPRALVLKKNNGFLHLASLPINTLAEISNNSKALTNLAVNKSLNISEELKVGVTPSLITGHVELKEFKLVFANASGEQLVIGYDASQNRYFIDRGKAGKKDFSGDFRDQIYAPRLSENKSIKFTVVLDVSSVEVFFDDGITVMTNLYFSEKPFHELIIKSAAEKFTVDSLVVKPLPSIW